MGRKSEYKKVGEFILNREKWISVKILKTGTVLTCPLKEWKKTYGHLNPTKWNNLKVEVEGMISIA